MQFERLKEHSSTILQNLRSAQDNLSAESARARAASDESEALRRKVALLEDETVAMRQNASRREEEHKEALAQAARATRAAELTEVAAREETAAAIRRLEASAREQREIAEQETTESLVKALEEMERQQSGVLSAALARSDAALAEVARVKEVREVVFATVIWISRVVPDLDTRLILLVYSECTHKIRAKRAKRYTSIYTEVVIQK